MPVSLTRDLGRFVSSISFDQLPPEAVAIAKLGFTDCIAVMIAGSAERTVELARSVVGAPAGVDGVYVSCVPSTAPTIRHGTDSFGFPPRPR